MSISTVGEGTFRKEAVLGQARPAGGSGRGTLPRRMLWDRRARGSENLSRRASIARAEALRDQEFGRHRVGNGQAAVGQPNAFVVGLEQAQAREAVERVGKDRAGVATRAGGKV